MVVSRNTCPKVVFRRFVRALCMGVLYECYLLVCLTDLCVRYRVDEYGLDERACLTGVLNGRGERTW